MPLSKQELAALGLPDDAELEFLAALPEPPDAGYGLSGVSRAAILALQLVVAEGTAGARPHPQTDVAAQESRAGVLRRMEHEPDFTPLSIPGIPWEAVKLSRWAKDPKVLVMDPPPGSLVLAGAWERLRSFYVALPGESGLLARCSSEHGDFVLKVGEGVYRVSPAVPDEAPEDIGPDHSDSPRLLSVDVRALLAGVPTAGWLLDELEFLSELDSDYHRVATVGLLGRLWEPPAAEVERLLRDATAGTIVLPPARCVEQARRWTADLHWVEGEALASARALERTLQDLPDWLDMHAEEDRSGALRGLVTSRDELESIAFVLDAAGVGEKLRAALSDVDRAAELQMTVFALEAELADDPRLAAASVSTPDAWWGVLA
jgi:hypothetical protein